MGAQSRHVSMEDRSPMHRIEYRMRGKDGQYRWILDQAKVVKRDPHGKPLRMTELRPAIKRLFISGFTAHVIAQRGILDDGVHFLSKPFGRDALARKVREVLDA